MSSKSKLFHYFTDEMVVGCLAFIGGFVDSAGFIKLFRLFTSSITGNLVVACASIYHPEGVLCRFLVSLCFAAGGGILTTIAVQLKIVRETNPKLASLVLFGCELASFVACWIVGQIYNTEIDNGDLDVPIVIVLGCMMGFSMGVHNAAAKESIPNCPSTTVMTMTLVSLSSSASNTVNLWLAKHSLLTMHPKSQTAASYKIEEKFKEHLDKLLIAVKPLITFLIGAVLGAVSMHELDFHCMWVPSFIVMLFLADLYYSYSVEKSSRTTSSSSTAAAPVCAEDTDEKEIEMPATPLDGNYTPVATANNDVSAV